MIGVIADHSDRQIVQEFFELFKTPWEFFQEDGRYDVVLSSGSYAEKTSARLVLVFGSNPLEGDAPRKIKIQSRETKPIISFEAGSVPLYGSCAAFRNNGHSLIATDKQNRPIALQLNSDGSQVIVRIGYDLFSEVQQLLSVGQPVAYSFNPTLELHIEFLRGLLIANSISWIEIPPVPEGHSFTACLTHDVDHVGIRNHKFDHTFLGFIYRATVGSVAKWFRGRMSAGQMLTNLAAAMKLPLVHLGLAKDFWYQFDQYLKLEEGLNSTFFVVPQKKTPGMAAGGGSKPPARATQYDIGDIPEEISKLRKADREIALHGIDAWLDSGRGKSEQQTIRRSSGAAKIGVRMHWLCFDENSPKALDEAGFWYDSTVGYNQCIGYRAGTGQVYRPPGVKRLLELPMHIMDTALFYPAYLNLSAAEAEERMGVILENAAQFGGAVTINWHDRSIAPERLWDKVYVNLLAKLKAKGAWFATAAQAVTWFEMRRAAVFEQSGWEGRKPRVKASNNSTFANLPGLRLRTYCASESTSGRPNNKKNQVRFVDTPLNLVSDDCLAINN